MASKVYMLNTQVGEHLQGSVVVKDSMGTWLIGHKSYDTRGNIQEGEFAMLLDFAERKKLTTVLEALDPEENEA